MVLLIGLVSFGVGLVLACAILRRATRRLRRREPDARWTWTKWRSAESIGGPWAPVIYVASFVAAAVGFYGFGASPEVRAMLLGVLAGVCLPPFVFGVWLWSRAR